jgi:hypothetical protein
LLSVYVGAMASLSLQAVAQRQRQQQESSSMEVNGEEPGEYLWCEQPPLAMALGLSPSALTRPIFAEASFFAWTQLPCAPEAAGKALAAVQCPLVVSVLLESRCTLLCGFRYKCPLTRTLTILQSTTHTITVAGLRDALVQALAATPLDYLPQPALPALATAYLALLRFLPHETGSEAARVLEWAKLAFHVACHIDDPDDAARIGRRLVDRLVALALAFQVQGAYRGG